MRLDDYDYGYALLMEGTVALTRSQIDVPGHTEDGARCMRAPSSKCQVALRNDLNAARISSTNSFGCSQAAKCVPFGKLL
jgi:hypothetical protein